MKTAKSYLMQIKIQNDAIEKNLRKLEKIRSEMLGTSGLDYSRDRVQVSPKDRMSVLVAEYVDLDKRINDMIDQYVDHRRKVMDRIFGLENKVHRMILIRRFVMFQSIGETAESMKRPERWVCRKQNAALKAFEAQYLVE